MKKITILILILFVIVVGLSIGIPIFLNQKNKDKEQTPLKMVPIKKGEDLSCKNSLSWAAKGHANPSSLGFLNCDSYENKGWCKKGKVLTAGLKKIGIDFGYPEKHCCVCGGSENCIRRYGLEGCNEMQSELRKKPTAPIANCENAEKR